MSYALSRLMSAGTLSYAVYALAEPRHLGRFMTPDPRRQADYDLVARTYGARDLAVGSLGLLGRSERTVGAAMVARIAFDISDGLLLAAQAKDDDTRAKVLGITWGYAALNATALMVDRRRARKKARLSR